MLQLFYSLSLITLLILLFSFLRSHSKALILFLTVIVVSATVSEYLILISLAITLYFVLRESMWQIALSIKNRKLFFSTFIFFLLYQVVFELTSKVKLNVLQFLTFGYDNAQHLGLFKVFVNEKTLSSSIFGSWENDFGLFREYPPGHALFTSYVSRVFFWNLERANNQLIVFFLINLAVFVSCIVIANSFMQENRSVTRKFSPRLLATVLAIYPWGILYTNGFGPYIFGILIILLVLSATMNASSFEQQITLHVLGTSLLLITTPSLVFSFIPSISVALFVNRDSYSVLIKSKQFIFSFLFGLLALTIHFQTSNNFGWRQLLGDGGVQPPSLGFVILISLISLFFLVNFFRKFDRNQFSLVIMSLLVTTVMLICLNVFFTGTVNYYAIKQFHIFSGFLCVYFVQKCFFTERKKMVFRTMAVMLLAVSVIGIIKPKQYTGAFMGHLFETVTNAAFRSDWQNEIVDANSVLSALEKTSNSSDKCLIYHVGGNQIDLNSRWLNSIGSARSITQDCFMSFWNRQDLSLSNFLATLSDQEVYLVFTSSDVLDGSLMQKSNIIIMEADWSDRS